MTKNETKKQNAPVEKGNIRKINKNHPRRDVLPVLMRNGELRGQMEKERTDERGEALIKEIQHHCGDGVIKMVFNELFGRWEIQ
jgi:hypothetical protein